MTCIIDGSHDRASSLGLAVAKYAESLGYVVPDDARELYDLVSEDSGRLVSALSGADTEPMLWFCDEVVEWLNDNAEGWHYIEDSCLWRDTDEED